MTAGNSEGAGKPAAIKVWDGWVRLFHWLLVACVATAAYTGFFGRKNQIDIHVIAGTAIAALLVFRIIWGMWGTTYARFSSFMVSPVTTLRHVRDIATGRGHACMGHNPLGAWMIVALFVVLTAILVTGTVTLGGVVKEGPLAPFVGFAAAYNAREVHEILGLVLGALVALHVLGAVFESFRTRENLMRSMVTGRKLPRPDAEAAAPVAARPVLVLVAVALVAGLTVPAVAHFSALPVPGVPTEPMNAAYAKECGSCHTPHHPTVAPAATWNAVFANLTDHFGDNASLEPALAEQLKTYVLANSSEKWDTRVANAMRTPSQEQPLRITDAPRWKRIHRELPEGLFKSKPIGGKLNCTNCHRDAESGVFAPREIAIKREKN